MSEHNKGNSGRDIAPIQPPYILQGPLTEAQRQRREQEEYRKERDRKDDAYRDRQALIEHGQLVTNRRIGVYTLILVIISTAGTVVAFLNAQAAIEAARAAERAANTATEQLRASTEQFRLDARAWIDVGAFKPVRVIPPDGQFKAWSFEYEIFPRNVGKTVATNVTVRASTIASQQVAADRGIRMFLDGLFKDQQTGEAVNLRVVLAATLAPNASTRAPIVLAATEPQHGMHQFMIGRIDYTDAFKHRHWSTFCVMVVNAAGDTRNCECCNEEGGYPPSVHKQPTPP